MAKKSVLLSAARYERLLEETFFWSEEAVLEFFTAYGKQERSMAEWAACALVQLGPFRGLPEEEAVYPTLLPAAAYAPQLASEGWTITLRALFFEAFGGGARPLSIWQQASASFAATTTAAQPTAASRKEASA